MRVRLTRRYELACAHRLTGLPEGHKCARLHGHNYAVEVSVSQAADKLANGMVLDAATLDVYVKPVLKRLDHRCLNELEPAEAFPQFREQPTAEHLALYLWGALKFVGNDGKQSLDRVRVFEESWLWAEVVA